MRHTHGNTRRQGVGVAAVMLVLASLVVAGRSAQAALPTPPPAGPQLTNFQIDGNPDGPNDWDAPYTAGTTPIGYRSSGMLPANFYPTFSAPDFTDTTNTPVPVPNPAYPSVPGAPEFCVNNQGAPIDNSWLNTKGDGKLSEIRLANPVYSNSGNVVLGCSNVNNKTDLIAAYAAYEIVEVPVDPADPTQGSQNEYILYGAWERNPAQTGELNFYIPVSDGVDGPVDGTGQPTNTAGDRLIAFDFSNTGVFGFQIWGWNEATGAWEVVDSNTGENANFDAAVGPAGDSAFGEFALNLTAESILPDDQTAGCQTVTVADYVFSATGNSASASLFDYVDAPGFDFTACGSLEVEKTAPFVPDQPVDFLFGAGQVDKATVFPADQIPATVPPSGTNFLVDQLSLPPPPTGTYPNPDIYSPMIAQQDYLISEPAPPPGWQLESLECTYKDIFDPILNPDGSPSGLYNEVTASLDATLRNTGFAVPPVLDHDLDGDIDDADRDYFRTTCVLTNNANTITIVKDAVPDDPAVDFPFSATLGAAPPEAFTLNDPTAPSRTFVVAQGVDNAFYEIDDQIPPFWDLTDATCDVPAGDPQVTWGPSTSGDDSGVTVQIGAGDVRNVTCTFTDTKRLQPYQILVTPATATNRLTDPHVFQVELRTDSDDDGELDDKVVGATVDLSLAAPTGSQIDNVNGVAIPPTADTTCTTADGSNPLIPEGTCRVVVSSPTNPGAGTLTASFDLPSPGAGVPELPTPSTGTTCTNPTITGGIITQCNAVQDVQRIEESAAKTWVGYEVTVEADATNPVDVEHTFTIDVVRTDGTTPTPAAGVVANFTWTGVGAVTEVNGVPGPATSCTTDAAGQCEVVVNSADFGSGILTVTSVEGDLVGLGSRVETPAPSSDLTATKTWVDWRVVLSPPAATNAVDQEHVITATLERNDGAGWVPDPEAGSILFTWSGPAGSAITAVSDGSVVGPSDALCNIDAAGQCTVTVDSPMSGTGTLTASQVLVSIAGYAPPGQAPGTTFPFDVDDVTADKTWVAIRGRVTPPTATNLVGDPHDFTILIETMADGGWVPAPAGTTVNFTWAGDGAVTAVVDPGPDATSCTLVSGGTCVVTVDSDVAGGGTLTIGDVTSLVVNGTQLVPAGGSLPVGDADASPEVDSRVGAKQWAQFQADVQETATNLAGDDHTFTLEALFEVGSGPTSVPDGSTITFTWSGTGSVTEVNGSADPGATSCVTTGGSCTVTVGSATPGSGTITITEVTASVFGTVLTGVTSTVPPGLVATVGGSLTADKTWASLAASVEADAVNLAGDDHTFTLSATYDDGTRAAAVPDGSTIAFTWTGDGQVTQTNGAPDVDATSCETTAGSCTVTVSSATPGSGTIEIVSVTVTALTGDVLFETSPGVIPDGSLTADKTWVEITVGVAATATNVVGDDHVFTLTATYDDGTGPQPANGASFAYTWSGAGTAAPPSPCVAAADANTCEVTVSSDVPGTGTITLDAVTATVLGTTFTDVTAAATAGESLTADKTWVQFQAEVADSATNLAGDDHTFTVEAYYDDGTGQALVPGGSTVTFTWTGAGSVTEVNGAPDAGATSCVTVGAVCTVTVSSATPGSGTIELVSVTATIGGTALTGVTTTTPPSLVATVGGSLTATKTWASLAASVEATAVNLAGDDHTFTLSATYDDGTGAVAVPDGSTIAFTWTGDGQVTQTNGAPDVDATSCETTAGSCTVTVSSATPGSGTIEIVSVTATIGGDVLFETSPGVIPDGSLTADKTWVEITVGVAATATNVVGDDHVFTLTATYDDGTGPQPANGASFAYTWSGAGTAAPPSPCVAAADANTCEVTVSSDVPGTGTITLDAVTATVLGATFTDVTAVATAGESLTADKTWVEFQATVADSATNLAGDDHTFTLSATSDDGTGAAAVPDGSTIAFTWTGDGQVTQTNGAADPDATSCVTTAGSCTVTVSSATPGSGDIELVSVTATIGGTALTGVTTTTPPSLVAAVGGSLTATKTWIEITVGVAATATNLTGDDHVFTLTAVYDDGTGPQPANGASFAYTWTGTGTAAPPSPCVAAADANTCEVTVSSSSPGTGTITIDTVTATVNGTTFTDVAAAATSGESLTADKTWVAFDVDITPALDFNLADQEHTFTISVRADDGGGLAPLAIPPDSGEVDWTFDAPDGSTPTGTCTLGAGGTCDVVQNSAVLGLGTLTATELRVVVDGAALTVDLTAAGSGQAPDLSIPVEARKIWLGYQLDLTPPNDVNLWPTEPDHVVTLTLTRSPELPELPIDGQELDVTLSSPVATITAVGGGGTIDTDGLTATCITDASGVCQVTITSTGPGTATLSASYTFVASTGTSYTFDGVNVAEKTWREFRVGVTPESATNLLGEPHTFTVLVESTDDGTTWTPVAGAAPTVAVTAPGVVDAETCSAGTTATGECTVTVSSPSTGSVTLTAEYLATIGEATATVLGDDAEKTWIDYRIDVAPREATNQVGDPHTFTVTLEVDRGSGFGPADGEQVQISTSGVGSVVGIDPAGPDGSSCTTDGDGRCQVTVNSQQPGALTLTASYLASVGSAERTVSAEGTKTWTTPPTTVPPTTAPPSTAPPPPTPAPPPPPKKMAPTGADIVGLAWLGAGVIGLGALIALRTRRRLRSTAL